MNPLLDYRIKRAKDKNETLKKRLQLERLREANENLALQLENSKERHAEIRTDDKGNKWLLVRNT